MRLGDVFAILDSQRVPVNAEDRAKRVGSVPYYGATGQVGVIDDYLFDEELVLLGEDGAPFLDPLKPKAYVVRGKSWVNNHAHVLRTLAGMSSAFWKHQLDSLDYHAFVSGTTRLKLPQAPMRLMNLVLPPIGEQLRIADAIESYVPRIDAAVASLNNAQTKLQAHRASVLKAAVEGRLVPTEAELARAEGRDYEPADILLKRILADRRRRWEEAELAKMRVARRPAGDDRWKRNYEEPVTPDEGRLPDLPEGWCWASVDALAIAVTYGSSAKTTADDPSGVAVLRMGNIVDGVLDLRDLKYLPHDHSEFPDLLLRPGDLLFNRTNSAELVGKSAVYAGYPERCSFASYLIKVEIVEGCEPRWVSAVLNSSFGRHWVASVVSQQVGQANVNGTKLKAFVLPLPPTDEQQRILSMIDQSLSKEEATRHAVEATLIKCARLRQSILKLAFEGKLVDQDPTDEPAQKLLQRIRAERAALTDARPKRMRKTKAAG